MRIFSRWLWFYIHMPLERILRYLGCLNCFSTPRHRKIISSVRLRCDEKIAEPIALFFQHVVFLREATRPRSQNDLQLVAFELTVGAFATSKKSERVQQKRKYVVSRRRTKIREKAKCSWEVWLQPVHHKSFSRKSALLLDYTVCIAKCKQTNNN